MTKTNSIINHKNQSQLKQENSNHRVSSQTPISKYLTMSQFLLFYNCTIDESLFVVWFEISFFSSMVIELGIYSNMETSEKHEYLKFFGNRTAPMSTHLPHSASAHKIKRYQHPKLLPHIVQQYNFRITNHLLLKKIISPKRDKTIMHSLQSIMKKNHSIGRHTSSYCVSRSKWRTSHKDRRKNQKGQLRRGQSESHLMIETNNQTMTPQEDDLQPQIKIKRKPKVNQNLQKSGSLHSKELKIIGNHIQDRLLETESKLIKNYQPRLMQGRSLHKQGIQNCQSLSGSYYGNLAAGFGNGPTIIMITHVVIFTNPSIKPDTLIQLQLIEKPAVSRVIRGIVDEQKQKAIRTNPISYQDLPVEESAINNGIKFAVKVSRIGDFVPLRIWKYSGVDCMQLGTIDLPLSLYKDKGKNGDSTGRQMIKLMKKQGNQNMGRSVLFGEVEYRLRKPKCVQAEAKAHIRYKVYSKKYSKITPKPQQKLQKAQ